MARRPRHNQQSLQGLYHDLRSDYAAAKSSRFRRRRTGVASSGSGADYHYRSEADYLRLMEQARDMDRNDSAVGPVINQAVNNTLQCGFTVEPRTGDPTLDADLWERWNAWADDPDACDLAGEHGFDRLTDHAFRAMLVDGDCVGLLTDEGAVQLVEAHRVRTPVATKRNVVHGVLLDDRRRRLQYWITKDDIDPLRAVRLVNEIQQYDTRDADGFRQIVHIYNPRRVTQTRGVTALAPIFDDVGMFEDINFAKLVQQQVVSCIAFFRMRQDGSPPGGSQFGERTEQQLSDGSTRVVEGIAPGIEIVGDPGEQIQGFSPNVPNPEFFEHVKLILTLVSINLGLPLIVVLMDASQTNFSGWRGALDQAKTGWRRNQRALIERWHRPIYTWKVRQWMAEDSALRSAADREGVSIFAHHWSPPTWPYIEPLKDASADLLRVRNGLISPRRLHAERGRDWEEVAEEIVADNAYAIVRAKRAAARINKKFKDDNPVHWREVLSLPTPDGMQISLQGLTSAGTGPNNSGDES